MQVVVYIAPWPPAPYFDVVSRDFRQSEKNP